MEFLIDYYGHDEEEARMFLYNQFEDNGLKMTVSDIMRQNRGCTIPELMAQLSIGLGAKSRAIILAESRNMKRHDGEAVQPFGMRVIDITQRKVLSDPNGKILLESDYVTEDALNTFYRGLRSKKFVEECLDQDAKSIQDAIVIITNYTARRIRLEECISDKEISFSSDKELFQHPEKGKFFVNAIFTANELDMNGNVAVDREDFINNVGYSNSSSCFRCGGNKSHPQNNNVCPAIGQTCYKCKGRDHFSNKCNAGKRNAPMVTPAQKRHGEKVQRQKALEARRINAVDYEEEEEEEEEEPEVGGLGDSSDDDKFSATDFVNALKNFKKEKKKKNSMSTW